jgi:UDP-N-acetylglucosamine transferase subunit ALG13
VTVGSTQNDFSRLLREVDHLVAEDLLQDVVAQTGGSSYQARNYRAAPFLPREEFQALLRKAEFVICHGGAATLDECLGFRKRVIVVPRQVAFKEVSDDHQLEIAGFLARMNRVLLVRDVAELRQRIREVTEWEPAFQMNARPHQIVTTIRQYIERTCAESDGS